MIEKFKDLPEEEYSLEAIESILNRIRDGWSKFGKTLDDYKKENNITSSLVEDAEERINRYKEDGEKRHLIDAIYYLYRELMKHS